MKIRDIEIEEKNLVFYGATRCVFNNVTEKNSIRWEIILRFKITDDFKFSYTDHKLIEYDQYDFDGGIDEVDNYIDSLKIKLDEIILKNGTK